MTLRAHVQGLSEQEQQLLEKLESCAQRASGSCTHAVEADRRQAMAGLAPSLQQVLC